MKVGSYHIGKERAYFGVAKALNWKVWCDANKRRVRAALSKLSQRISPQDGARQGVQPIVTVAGLD